MRNDYANRLRLALGREQHWRQLAREALQLLAEMEAAWPDVGEPIPERIWYEIRGLARRADLRGRKPRKPVKRGRPTKSIPAWTRWRTHDSPPQ